MKCRMMKKISLFLVVVLGAQSSLFAMQKKHRTEAKLSHRRTKPALVVPATPVAPIPVVPAKTVDKVAPLIDASTVTSKENDVRMARAIGGRKEEKSSFAKKIDAYAAKMKAEHGHKDANAKLLADALYAIKETDQLKDVKTVIAPIKRLVDQSEQNGQKMQVQDQIGLSLLLKASLPLGEQARSIICEMLHKLDTYIAYWREQKHHPISYFFHKNPKKWVVGPKQKVEIEKNIKELVAVRDDHLRLLSKLAEHESYFEQSASVNEQYEWLARYLSMISTICYNTQAKLEGIPQDEATRFDKLLTLVNDMLGRVSFHEDNVSRVLGGAKKPGHITRNWIAYSALAIGASALTWYARRNQERFYNWFNTGVKEGVMNFGTSAFSSGRDFVFALIGKSAVRPGNNGMEVHQTIDEQLVQFQNRLRGLRDNLLGDNQPYENNQQLREGARAERARALQENARRQCQGVVNAYQETRNQLIQERLLMAQEPLPNLEDVRFEDLRSIIRQVLGNALADCNRITAQLNVPQEAAPGLAAPAVPVGDAPEMPADLRFGFGLGVNLGQPVNDEINNYIRQAHHFVQHHLPQIRNLLNNDVLAYQKSIPAVGRLAGDVIALLNAYITLLEIYGNNLVVVGADLIDTVANTIEPIRTEVARNQATIILTSLAPAAVVLGGSAFGLSKLYKAFKYKPDFKPMREALIDIGHLLNEEGMIKNADEEQLDQGKILYLVWKLKREAENVPLVQRDQFLADVTRLGRSDLDHGKRIWTAEKKLRIIDLMYRTYDFLNPAYVAQ